MSPKAVAVAAATLLGVLLAGFVTWHVRVSSPDEREQQTARRQLAAAVAMLHDDPTHTGWGHLPDSVATAYEPVGAGAAEMTGWLYIEMHDGRCMSTKVTISKTWLETGDESAFTATKPALVRSCPNQD